LRLPRSRSADRSGTIFRYERALSQRSLAFRDIVSTGVNVLFTGTVATAFFVPLIIFLPEFALGRSLFFGSSNQLGPLWLQLILVALLYSFLRYGIHRVQHIVPFLWELHSYHHSVTVLKASNTFVSHPIDFACVSATPFGKPEQPGPARISPYRSAAAQVP